MKVPNLDLYAPQEAKKRKLELASSMDDLPRIERPAAREKPGKVKPPRKKTDQPSPIPPQQPEAQSSEEQEILQARKQESKIARNLANIVDYLELKSLVTTSFRYPQELLDKLEEVQHQMRRSGGKKVTKNAILIVALAAALQDYEENGNKSDLVQNLSE